MYPGDARSKWRPDLLTDPRISHWWDDRRLVGLHMIDKLRPHAALRAEGSRPFEGKILWDAYLLFDRRARWAGAFPTALVRWGYPIMPSRAALAGQIDALMQRGR